MLSYIWLHIELYALKAQDKFLAFRIAQIDRQLAIEYQKVAYYEKRLSRG